MRWLWHKGECCGLIEKSFHEAISTKDIDELVRLFAPHATATFGPGKTVTERIRSVGSG